MSASWANATPQRSFESEAESTGESEIALGTRLALIRHGEAVCNAESFIGGHVGCRGLTAKGREQVTALAERISRTGELSKAAALYTSILPRAIESTELLANALGIATFTKTCDLCERHPGEADGLSWAEYEERYRRPSLPGDVPDLALSEGGESWIEFLARAEKALVAVALSHPGELSVIVAHGGIIDSSMIQFLRLSDHGTRVRLHPEHTSITEWEYVGQRWRLVRYSDAAHLDLAGLRSDAPEWVHEDRSDADRWGR